MVVGAPLAELLTDDQRPLGRRRDRVDGVIALRHLQRPDLQIRLGGHGRGAVGAGAPHLSERDQPAHDLAASYARRRIFDFDFFTGKDSRGLRWWTFLRPCAAYERDSEYRKHPDRAKRTEGLHTLIFYVESSGRSGAAPSRSRFCN